MPDHTPPDVVPSPPPRGSGPGEGENTSSTRYFCNEPWIGVLSIEVDGDVTFCPCYLKLGLGNVETASLQELWNAPALVEIRRAFSAGALPSACRGQLCAPALGTASYLSEIPSAEA